MSDVDFYDVESMIRNATVDLRAELRAEYGRAVAELRDDVLELGRSLRDAVAELAAQESRDVAALRESIRATDRVLADRTAHLA